MRVLWICGLPDDVRLHGTEKVLTPRRTPAWSWVLGHLPPPAGIELHILCPVLGLDSSEVHFHYLGAHWHCFCQQPNELPRFWLRFYWRIRRYVARHEMDFIHGWGGESGCGWLATLLSSRAIVSVQGQLRMLDAHMREAEGHLRRLSLQGRLMRLIEGWTYRRAAVRLVESRASADGLKRYYGQDSTVVPQPLRAVFLEGDVPLRRDAQELQVLYVGRLIDQKGPLDALQALERNGNAWATAVFIGSGPQDGEVRQFIAEHHWEDRVEVVSECSADEVRGRMSRAHIFLLPSYGDTGPTVLKEALALGCYPVCYDNSGPHELITKYGGALAKTGDVGDLTAKLAQAISLVRAGDAGREERAQAIRRELCRENVWKRLLEAYEKT